MDEHSGMPEATQVPWSHAVVETAASPMTNKMKRLTPFMQISYWAQQPKSTTGDAARRTQ
jgi:hypothetical protein